MNIMTNRRINQIIKSVAYHSEKRAGVTHDGTGTVAVDETLYQGAADATTNALNQYTAIRNSCAYFLRGEAPTGVTVPPTREGFLFFKYKCHDFWGRWLKSQMKKLDWIEKGAWVTAGVPALAGTVGALFCLVGTNLAVDVGQNVSKMRAELEKRVAQEYENCEKLCPCL
jgi:hypothetical protein